MPFDKKAEIKKIEAFASMIKDPKARKALIEKETKALDEHEAMLKRMSKFVNAKNKNSAGNGQHGTF